MDCFICRIVCQPVLKKTAQQVKNPGFARWLDEAQNTRGLPGRLLDRTIPEAAGFSDGAKRAISVMSRHATETAYESSAGRSHLQRAAEDGSVQQSDFALHAPEAQGHSAGGGSQRPAGRRDARALS